VQLESCLPDNLYVLVETLDPAHSLQLKYQSHLVNFP